MIDDIIGKSFAHLAPMLGVPERGVLRSVRGPAPGELRRVYVEYYIELSEPAFEELCQKIADGPQPTPPAAP